MPPEIIKLDYDPDTSEAKDVLADIVADIRTLRIPSDTKLNLYALKRLRAHQDMIAIFDAAADAHEKELKGLFAALRAEVGDPLPLASDGGEDTFDHIENQSKSFDQKGQNHD